MSSLELKITRKINIKVSSLGVFLVDTALSLEIRGKSIKAKML